MTKENIVEKQTCGTCGGVGQIEFFQGESRFLLTSEECPQCFGTGYIIENKSKNQEFDSIDEKGDGDERS